MDFRMNPRLMSEIHNSATTEEQVLLPAAHAFAARVAARTPTDTGATRDSTRVEGRHRSADGRSRAARVVQGGPGTAAVQTQFGNSRTRADRQFDQARGGT